MANRLKLLLSCIPVNWSSFPALLCGVVCLFCSCTAEPLSEARHTLDVADSLRVNEGRLYDDSLALAEAYTLLGHWRLIYPDDYARACYYYGYLLRQHNNQVAAMQAFIAGSHAPYVSRVVPLPWFSNSHILGRIYSNMGTMCHLADEFELSYEMYEQSSKSFYRGGDTTLYYYMLNDMALELAEQNMYEATLALLDSVERNCTNQGVLTKLWETKAIMYYNIGKYDSAIISVKQLQNKGNHDATGYVKEAQSFDCMGLKDSALYYAKHVMSHPYASNQDRYHVLYILINYDNTISKQEVQVLSSERADLNNELIEPLLLQLHVAVELLRQDIGDAPSLQKIIVILIILSLAGVSIVTILVILRKNIIRLLTGHHRLKKENEEIRQSSENIKQQNSAWQQQIIQDIENTCEIIRQYNDWDKQLHWKNYNELCEFINQHFYLLADKLKQNYHLDEKELRLSILVLLDMFNNDTIAKILHYGKGIRTYKSRLNAKLGNVGNDLRTKLIQIAVFPFKSFP